MHPMIHLAIIGAPKSGTTSLAEWLGRHPDVFMSGIKEPEYFSTDEDCPWPRVISTEAAYRHLFRRAQPHQLRGEATCRYLFSRTAVPALLEMNPQIKLIVMARNPLEMAPSLHAQRMFNRRERRKDFAAAWRRSPGRDRWRDYRQLCAVGAQLRRLLKLVDRQQVHVIVFDDLKADPAAVYRGVLDFLGLQLDGRTRFPVSNQRREHRHDWIDSILRDPPLGLAQLKRLAMHLAPRASKGLRRKIDDANSQPVTKTELTPELRREMADHFRMDVALLGRLLNRDLSHWLA